MPHTATAGEVSKAFGRFSRRALIEPLTITNRGDDALVLLSKHEYERLKRRDREVLSIQDVACDVRDAVAASEPSVEAEAFNHEV